MIQHFRNTLTYIAIRQKQHAERESNGEPESPSEEVEEGVDGENGTKKKKVELGWDKVDVVGACLKMGITR